MRLQSTWVGACLPGTFSPSPAELTGPGRAWVPLPAVAVDRTSERTAPSGGTGEAGHGGAEPEGQPRGNPHPSLALWSAEAGTPASCCPRPHAHAPPASPSQGYLPGACAAPGSFLPSVSSRLRPSSLQGSAPLCSRAQQGSPLGSLLSESTPGTLAPSSRTPRGGYPATPALHSLQPARHPRAPPSRQLPGPGLLSATLVALSHCPSVLTSHLRPLEARSPISDLSPRPLSLTHFSLTPEARLSPHLRNQPDSGPALPSAVSTWPPAPSALTWTVEGPAAQPRSAPICSQAPRPWEQVTQGPCLQETWGSLWGTEALPGLARSGQQPSPRPMSPAPRRPSLGPSLQPARPPRPGLVLRWRPRPIPISHSLQVLAQTSPSWSVHPSSPKDTSHCQAPGRGAPLSTVPRGVCRPLRHSYSRTFATGFWSSRSCSTFEASRPVSGIGGALLLKTKQREPGAALPSPALPHHGPDARRTTWAAQGPQGAQGQPAGS